MACLVIGQAAATGLGCNDKDDAAERKSATVATVVSPPASSAQRVDWIDVPAGDELLENVVLREMARADADKRDLFIYVGATWCEPCERFHRAAQAGALDATFPTLRILAFDRDRDEVRLRAAGCMTKLIPLFARPNKDGRCDLDRSMTGSIKGPGAVANITPRLRKLVGRLP